MGHFRQTAWMSIAGLYVLLGLCVLPTTGSAQQPTERLFYYAASQDGWESLQRNIEMIDVLAPSGYSVDEAGVVWGGIDPRVLELAREHEVPVMPLIVNPGFNQEMLHQLLTDSVARGRAIRSMVEESQRHGYLGFQFDFENLSIDDRDAFTRFFQEAATALHGAGHKISIAVVHRPDEFPGPTRYHKWLFENWRAGYDLKALAGSGDFISLMSYSQHTRRTPPGPQAGIPWVESVVSYFLQFMPPEKLSLGIPTGSQHWFTSQEDRITPEMARSYSEQLGYGEAMGMLDRFGASPIWSDEHKVPYAFFSNGGTFEWIFLENARSFAAKLDLMDRHRLRGFSVWVLGPEDPAIWGLLRERR